jgi:anaerobic selenocysteine-containing dehydrogenase
MSGLPPADEFEGEGRWLDMVLPWERMHFLDGFGHPDGKFHFKPNWRALGPHAEGMPEFPDHAEVIEAADEEHPFRMVAPPARSFLNTTFNNTPSGVAREGRPTARIHPDDLVMLGLADGDRLRLGNRRGSVVLHARAFDGLQRGVIVVEGIWPNAAYEEGIGINALTSADPGRPRGGAVFHDTAVWARPA